VTLTVSPETTTDAMAGVDADADCGAGQDGEALPEAVQLRAVELGVACPDVEPDVPQAQRSAKANVSVSRCIVILWNAAPAR